MKPKPEVKPKPLPEEKPAVTPNEKRPVTKPSTVTPSVKQPVLTDNINTISTNKVSVTTEKVKTNAERAAEVKHAASIAGNARMQMLDDSLAHPESLQAVEIVTDEGNNPKVIRREAQAADAIGIGRHFKTFSEMHVVDRLSVYALVIALITLTIFTGYVLKNNDKDVFNLDD
ncbi:hypothetical protein EQG49_08290 [Periweissella cryptocerci]|uniref:Uncharacterized protein n=1 Tax=Periweissella cryptocerci TaxID=2506420 RepID=A0A4P6YUK3_9LACO|nr:hypothetical protein EQG49_08290 [Periweissella cryptocerci]